MHTTQVGLIQKRSVRSRLFKLGVGLVAAGVLLLLLGAAVATHVKRLQETDTIPDVQKIARTLEIIRTSTPANRKVLKVLFYGQSITRSGWHIGVMDHWRQKYPNTVFVVKNLAVGGFDSESLLRTTEQDIASFYPDLIIFHVYGDHHAYERIVRIFRSQTAADVILQTDHGEILPDPPCAEGLQLSLHRAPGCAGLFWVHQRIWADEMSYHKIPGFAKKYGVAMEPQRGWWRDYLLRTHTPAQSLLTDDVHPNTKGKELIAGFFNQYFDNLVDHWNGETEPGVVSIPSNAPKDSHGNLTLSFAGNRLEILSTKALAVLPAALIDGSSPRDIDGCYQATRTTPVESVPDWPALRRVTLLHDHTSEDWTATVVKVSPDEKSFEFAVKDSTGGDQGSGNSAQKFVSKSGRLSIEPGDWMFGRAYDYKHVPLAVPFEVHWSVNYVCGGDAEVIDRGNGVMQYRYVLATGLSNAKHSVQLSSPANNLADVTEFRAYEPPLRDE